MAQRGYCAPLELMQAALLQAAAAGRTESIPGYAEVLGEVGTPVLENAARFAAEILSPLNRVGDQAPSVLGPDGVVTPPGFAAAYDRFRNDGWVSLGAPAELGGQNLPALLAAAVTEMWGGANLAFAMCPELAVGAIRALRAHAPAAILEEYGPRLASGEWTATMCLTEPQSGSDLSTVRTLAEPDGDCWRLRGRKIYISWGEHDLAPNIVHLVLARTPGAPAGLKGISLFLVPRYLRSNGAGLTPNDIQAIALEHKMGIRASPTCVMALGERDGAKGWLIGQRHAGLACMFTVMNPMRLGVGLHSLGLAERALQLARAHALERLQGRDATGAQRPIIEHADVRRMLLTMKSLTHSLRCLSYTVAATIDVAESAPSGEERAAAARRADLLTPVVKAWGSDTAVEVASLGVQVHGGLGFVDACEISQIFRDARIGPIFEGTNYIQAQDLLARKVVRDGGRALEELLQAIERAAGALDGPRLIPLRDGLARGCALLRLAVRNILGRAAAEPDLIGATAHHFLQWVGTLCGGWQLALAAPGARSMIDCAAFYGSHILPRMHIHAAIVAGGTESIRAASLTDI